MMLPDHRVNAESFHQPVELAGIRASGFGRIARPGEVPIFHTLCKEKITVTLPKESLDLIGTSATEKEKCVRNKKGEMIPVFDNGGKAVHSETHICTPADDIDTCEIGRIGIPKNGVPPG